MYFSYFLRHGVKNSFKNIADLCKQLNYFFLNRITGTTFRWAHIIDHKFYSIIISILRDIFVYILYLSLTLSLVSHSHWILSLDKWYVHTWHPLYFNSSGDISLYSIYLKLVVHCSTQLSFFPNVNNDSILSLYSQNIIWNLI